MQYSAQGSWALWILNSQCLTQSNCDISTQLHSLSNLVYLYGDHA